MSIERVGIAVCGTLAGAALLGLVGATFDLVTFVGAGERCTADDCDHITARIDSLEEDVEMILRKHRTWEEE